MLLNGGVYNNKMFLSPEIIEQFTQTQPDSHRGLGFDKPIEGGVHGPDAPLASFGHLGFTGGALWIDPENEIVFVFLSNRISPDVSNTRISRLKVRQKVHQAIYDAMVE
jgi:CubicO group peptidase (beta-lactamase class C family)